MICSFLHSLKTHEVLKGKQNDSYSNQLPLHIICPVYWKCLLGRHESPVLLSALTVTTCLYQQTLQTKKLLTNSSTPMSKLPS